MNDPLTKAYFSFCAYSTTEFEDFLLQFQSDEPRIYSLYSSMCKLVSNLQQKFIRKKLLSDVDSDNNLLIDIHFKENRKALQSVDIGTKQSAYLMNRKTSSKLLETSWTNFERIARIFICSQQLIFWIAYLFTYQSYSMFNILPFAKETTLVPQMPLVICLCA